ncbi:MAG: class I SAM-dependent methyltransferase [Planctomycetota bacterium]|nr:class I SAM-dependent methyltransferase [Planctomycetota bacterium]
MPLRVRLRDVRAFLDGFERRYDLAALSGEDRAGLEHWRRHEAPRWTESLNLVLRGAPRRVLNLGTYYGFLDLYLKDELGLDVLGVDHPEVAPRLEPYWRANGLQVLLCDLAREALLVEAASFDAVLACEIVEHVRARPRTVFARAREALKPGGALVATTPNVARLSNVLHLLEGKNIQLPLRDVPEGSSAHATDHWHHIREYTPAELAEEARAAGFADVERIMSACWDRPGAAGERSLAREVLKGLWFPCTFVFRRWRSCIMLRARNP